MHDFCRYHIFVRHSGPTLTDRTARIWQPAALLSNPPIVLRCCSSLAACLYIWQCMYVALQYIISLTPCRIVLSGVFSTCRPLHVADKLFRCAPIDRQNTTQLLSGGGGGEQLCTPTHIMKQEHFRSAVHWKECRAVSRSVLWPGLCSKLYSFSSKNTTALICFISE